MNVATFPQPSLAGQLAELKRERAMRVRVFPRLIANRTLTEHQAAYQNAALDGAIATLERLVDAQARGEPGRGELVRALRRMLSVFDTPSNGGLPGAEQETCAHARALLERIPEDGP